jgi:hypothetical protein
MHIRRCQPQSQWIPADFRARLLFTHFGPVARQGERNAVARAPYRHEMPHLQDIGPYTNQFALNRARRSIVIGRLFAHVPPTWYGTTRGVFMPQARKAVVLPRQLTVGSRYLAGIFACFQAHYQLDNVVVRVSRDAHLVDHALDQEHSPAPRRLRIVQLSLQVRSLRRRAR